MIFETWRVFILWNWRYIITESEDNTFVFFQNLAQSYILTELMNEIKEHGTKLKIIPSSDSQLVRSLIIWIIAPFR